MIVQRKIKLSQRDAIRSDEASSEESQRESCSEATYNSTSIVTSDSTTAPPPPAAVPQEDAPSFQDPQPKLATKRSISQEIPKLPKPVSARDERSKLTKKKSTEMLPSSCFDEEKQTTVTSISCGAAAAPAPAVAGRNVTVVSIGENTTTTPSYAPDYAARLPAEDTKQDTNRPLCQYLMLILI